MDQERKKNRYQSNHEGEAPKFGRLLIILLLVVIFIGILTFATEAYYRHNPISG